MPHSKTRPARRAGGCLQWVLMLAAGWLTATAAVHAASIGVSPTLIELNAGESVAGLRVSNGDAAEGVSVQARLLRWRQDATGEDVYTPAEGVVASPPVSRIAPNAENLIRLVRTSKAPAVGEEAYRLLIDQLPQPGAQAAGTVAILIRHSVPMFVSGTAAKPAQPQWRIERAVQPSPDQENPPPGWRVVVTNSGDKRLRLANLELRNEAGRVVGERPGLVGYVLGRSTVGFFVEAGEVEAGDASNTLSPGSSPINGRGAQATAAPAALRIVVQSETGAMETALLPVVAATAP